jgi:hypothetical protein
MVELICLSDSPHTIMVARQVWRAIGSSWGDGSPTAASLSGQPSDRGVNDGAWPRHRIQAQLRGGMKELRNSLVMFDGLTRRP